MTAVPTTSPCGPVPLQLSWSCLARWAEGRDQKQLHIWKGFPLLSYLPDVWSLQCSESAMLSVWSYQALAAAAAMIWPCELETWALTISGQNQVATQPPVNLYVRGLLQICLPEPSVSHFPLQNVLTDSVKLSGRVSKEKKKKEKKDVPPELTVHLLSRMLRLFILSISRKQGSLREGPTSITRS